jgi:hypothetical protein
MSLWEFGVRAGLYRDGDARQREVFDTALKKCPDDRLVEFFARIAPRSAPFKSRMRATKIK